MDTTRWKTGDGFVVLDLVAELQFKTASSVSFRLGTKGDALQLPGMNKPWVLGAGRVFTAVRGGQAFLATTQRPDGAWAIASRAIFRNGKRATNLEPITHAGSAWAVMGLVRSSPAVARPGNTVSK
jgi:hypothetical protein